MTYSTPHQSAAVASLFPSLGLSGFLPKKGNGLQSWAGSASVTRSACHFDKGQKCSLVLYVPRTCGTQVGSGQPQHFVLFVSKRSQKDNFQYFPLPPSLSLLPSLPRSLLPSLPLFLLPSPSPPFFVSLSLSLCLSLPHPPSLPPAPSLIICLSS